MTPKKLASELRRVASTLEASKKPRRDLVVADLKKIVASLNDIRFENIDPFTLVVQVMEKVKKGEATPQEAADYLSERPEFEGMFPNAGYDPPGSHNKDQEDADTFFAEGPPV